MASPTQRTWVWASSRNWWWTGRHGVLQSMGLQRVGQYWATELTVLKSAVTEENVTSILAKHSGFWSKKKKKTKKKGMLDRVVHSTKWGSLLHVSHSAYSFVISSLSSPFFKLLNWKQNFLQSPPLIFLPPCPVFVGPYWDFTVLELSHQTVNHPGKLSIKAPFFCQWLSLVLFGPFN